VYHASHREFLPHNLSLAHYTLQAGQVRLFILLFYLFVLQYLKITGILEEGYDAYFGEKQEHRLQTKIEKNLRILLYFHI